MINILICFLLIILGMIFYATLAGLAGATVSRIEEMTEGLTLFTFTNLIGVYTALGAANVLMGPGINGFVIFSFLFSQLYTTWGYPYWKSKLAYGCNRFRILLIHHLAVDL